MKTCVNCKIIYVIKEIKTGHRIIYHHRTSLQTIVGSSSRVLRLLRTEVIVYVVERSPNGTSKRIPATTLFGYLEQANVKMQLTQIGVIMSVTRTELSPAQLKQLLQNAPAGKCVCVCVCVILTLNSTNCS